MNKKNMKTLFMASAFSALLIFSACEKDNGGGNNNNNNPPTPSGKAYFNLDGQVFVGANSPSFNYSVLDMDTQVNWTGKGGITDTNIYVRHVFPNFKIGFYTIDSGIAYEPGKVNIGATWGYEASSPFVEVTSGTYELKRENNKFVGYLTNGKGKNSKNGKRYNSITMKFIYPF